MKLRYSPRALGDLAAISDYLVKRTDRGAAGNAAFAHGRDASGAIERGHESVSVNEPGKTGPAQGVGPAPRRLRTRAKNRRQMSASDRASGTAPSGHWIANQPYLLLSITALCWAGNAIVGRLAAGHIPPVTLSFLRWSLAFLIILPFAWKHLKHDWAAIRELWDGLEQQTQAFLARLDDELLQRHRGHARDATGVLVAALKRRAWET